MEEAKVVDLANKILKLDKKQTSFFEFINAELPDDNSILSFINQIDIILSTSDSLELSNVKYIAVALIEDNNMRKGYISQLESLSEEEQEKIIDNLPSDYFRKQIIVGMTNKLTHIDKIQSVKAKTRIIGQLSSEELNSYVEQKTQEERDVIIKQLPIDLVVKLRPNYVSIWRQTGDTKLIAENIDLFLQKHGIVNEEDRRNRTDILSRMHKKNERIYNTIDFELLNEQYISLLGENIINQFSGFKEYQEMLLTLGQRKDLGLKIFAKCIENHKDEATWTQLADVLLNNLVSGEYDDLLKNIKSLDNLDINKLSAILQHSNIFEITTQDDIEEFDTIRHKKCEEWIKSDDISKKKLAVLEKIFGQDLIDTHAILEKYSTDIDAIEDEDLKAYIKSLQVIYNSNDGTLLERIYEEVQEVELINQFEIEKELKKEYGKLLNEGLLTVDENLTQLNELGNNIYDAGTDFKIIMTSIGAFVDQSKERGNYCEDWNRADIGCQHICTSYIRNDMIGTAPINNICYGFSNMAEGSLMMGDSGDTISSARQFSSKANSVEKYFKPDNLVNNTVGYNELDFARQQGEKKKQPDYILVFKRDGKIPNLDEAKKAQEDWGGTLPIVVVDVDRCLENEQAKIEEMKKQYIKNPTQQLQKEICQKIRNNQVTASDFCPNIEDFFEQHQDKSKKNLKTPVVKKIKSIYHKVQQKAEKIIGLMTAREAYESTTATERKEELSKFRQILSQVQEISKGEENNER